MRGKEQRLAYSLLLPAIIFIGILGLFPFLYNIYLSLLSYTVGQKIAFIGLGNYVAIFSDRVFYSSLTVTAIFSAIALGSTIILGLFLALLLVDETRTSKAASLLLMLPLVMTPIVSASTWGILYDPTFGLFDQILKSLGFGVVDFLGNPLTVLPSLALIEIWEWTPFMALVLLAGMRSIPRTPLEAAKVDGASYLQELRFVLLPMLRPYLFIGVIFSLVNFLRVFDIIIATTNGGPGTSSETLNFYTFLTSFNYFHISYGATLAIVQVAITSILAQAAFRLIMRKAKRE